MDYYFVLPETISLQENTQTEVILAIELHCDNPVDDKGNYYKFIENYFFQWIHSCEMLPWADAGVGCIVGLSWRTAEEHTQPLMVDRV